jgi:serine protease Do
MPRTTLLRASLARLTALAAATAVGTAILAAPSVAAAPPDTSLDDVPSIVQPSVVQLHTRYTGLVRDKHGNDVTGGKPVEVTTTCSAFIVNPNGFITTAGRCVDLDVNGERLIDAAARRVFEQSAQVAGVRSLDALEKVAHDDWTVVSPSRPHRAQPDRKVIAISDVFADQAGASNALPASVRRVRGPRNGDVAVVKVREQDLPALELAPSVSPGTPAASFSFQGSAAHAASPALTPSLFQGSIGDEETVDGGLNQAFEVDTPISAEMVGGPTVDLDGRVLGVIRSPSTRGAASRNLIAPTTDIRQLLQDIGAPNELGAASVAYRSGLAAFFSGDRDTALALFDRTLKLQPALELARIFRSRALKLPKSSDEALIAWLINAILSVPGLAGTGAAGTGGGAIAVRRRRRKRADVPSVAGGGDDETPALVVQNGDLAGHRFAVTKKLVIGRYQANIVLDDQRISRRHAVVRPIEGGMEIEDLGSANGTCVNGVAIHGARRLRQGDVVQVGRIALKAKVPAPMRDDTMVVGASNGPHVVVTSGSLTGQRYPVRTELLIGRRDADLLLDDPQVSRSHAVVRMVNGALEIEDLHSANGTFVNGSRIDGTQRLRPGDAITIGPIALEAQIGDGRDAGGETAGAG